MDNRPIQKLLRLNKHNYFETHLSLVNAIIPKEVKMTPKELEVLARFMSFDGDIAESDRFGTSCKKLVKEQLNLSDGGLGNYMKALKNKGFLYEQNGQTVMRDWLNSSRREQLYNFKLVNTDTE